MNIQHLDTDMCESGLADATEMLLDIESRLATHAWTDVYYRNDGHNPYYVLEDMNDNNPFKYMFEFNTVNNGVHISRHSLLRSQRYKQDFNYHCKTTSDDANLKRVISAINSLVAMFI